MYASTLGRFNTADPYQASGGPGDPGSWNRCSYTQGDPVNGNDPTGLATCRDSTASYCLDVADSLFYLGALSGSGGVFRPIREDVGPSSAAVRRQGVRDQLLSDAIAGSVDRLSNPECSSLFGGSLFANGPASVLQSALDNGQIRILPFGDNIAPGVLAQTTGTNGMIQIASGRAFFTGTVLLPTTTASSTTTGGSISGYDTRSLSSCAGFGGLSSSESQQLILMHELLHFMGVVGPDNQGQSIYNLPNGETVTGSTGVTQAVRTHCFDQR